MKDKEKEEKPSVDLQDKTEGKLSITEGTEETESVLEKPDTPEETSDISDSVECVPEVLNHDSEGRDVSPVNWDTDTVETHPSMDTSCSGLGSFPSSQNGIAGRRSPAVDDSSSTCSTDSTPSVVMNGSYRGNHLSNHKNQKSASRHGIFYVSSMLLLKIHNCFSFGFVLFILRLKKTPKQKKNDEIM